VQNFERAIRQEWLETNGLGGFASSTSIGLNTRRYHGLLTAATSPPAGRILMLSKIEETLVVDGRRYDLSCNQYPGAIYPEGHRYLREFRHLPFPAFVYEVEGIEVEKRVFMVDGENTTVVEYELRGAGSGCMLELRPLIAFRDYHALTHHNTSINTSIKPAINPHSEARPGMAVLTPYAGLPSLYLAYSEAAVERGSGWYYDFEYALERERGLDFHEDLFNPLVVKCALQPGSPCALIAGTEPHEAAESARLRLRETARRMQIMVSAPVPNPLVRTLAAAADQFIVKRGDLTTIIAGYHWFCAWGRDTMIALPGLTLVTGRFDTAKGILLEFAENLDQGMLPNRFPETGETPEYNTVDAALWFFEAVRAYGKYTGDYEFIEQSLYAGLKEIVDWHLRGTRYGIRVDGDGLVTCGEPGVQLTWMDAKVGDWVVTPRYGKPVEIQALWYNALRTLQDLAHRFSDAGAERNARELADQARISFRSLFWNEPAGCLYDVVNGDLRDASVRPNQIFAVSLPHRMLPAEQAHSVVSVVDAELRTPMGLRSLSPKDPQYRPRYEGGVMERDGAYHQGTVWPWLLGPFITAYLKVHGRSDAAREEAAQWLAGFGEHENSNLPGQVPEIADGDAPHAPRGCVAQAWSVAELLRAAVEDVYGAQRHGIAEAE
jgi:predicted glycogen debranching enzyme